jgi:dihydrofolate reductase
MRKLKIFEHVSMDGVLQHSADQNGFAYSDWSAPYRSPEGRDMLAAMYGETYDLVFGRQTYDILSGFWPKAPSSPMSDRINAAKKYVVTHRPESLEWGPYEAVGSDLVEKVRRLKSTDGPDILVWGSSTVTSPLLEHGLADELIVTVFPVWLGTGKRLFAEGTPAQKFEFVSSQATPTGVLLNVYKVLGAMQAE